MQWLFSSAKQKGSGMWFWLKEDKKKGVPKSLEHYISKVLKKLQTNKKETQTISLLGRKGSLYGFNCEECEVYFFFKKKY